MRQRKKTKHRPLWEQSEEDDLPPGAGARQSPAAARYRARLPRRAPLDIEEEEYALFREDHRPASPEIIDAFASLQWGWKHLRKIGSGGRYEARAWEDLMAILLRLPPLRELRE
jgi:hypothetical protein